MESFKEALYGLPLRTQLSGRPWIPFAAGFVHAAWLCRDVGRPRVQGLGFIGLGFIIGFMGL